MSLRTLAVALGASAVLFLSACGGAATPGASTPATSSAESEAPAADKVWEIGIVNLLSHPALDAAQQGFIDGLADAGYKDGEKVNLELQNAQNDQATLTAIANQLTDKDLVFAIATPSGQAVAQVITDKPILFAAVTDPVAAELVASWEAPGGNITGASDLNPVEDQLKLILEIDASVKTVGIVYSSGEVNAEVQVEAAEKAAAGLGLTIMKAAVTNSSEVQQAAQSLDVDAYYIPTDNTVVSGIEGLIQVAEQNQAVVVASDEGSVERGAIASQSVNYDQQGRDAAAMAVQIFEGADPATMPVKLQDTFDLTVNPEAAKRMGATIPEDMAARAVKTF
ncbi:MAG: ABC transporter substrate-binding protein [Propionibacteriaceae bacterium]|nr:ABC transporter substrate-binding protein [Propionibacteriaceae bacterium]